MNEAKSAAGAPLRGPLDRSATALARCDRSGTIRAVNPAMEALLGRGAGDLVGSTVEAVLGLADPTREAARRAELFAGGRAAYTTVATVEGATEPLQLHVVVTAHDEGDAPGMLVQLEPIAEVDPGVAGWLLRERALHDPLTGLPTRPLLMDRIRAASRRTQRHARGFACLFIDLDHFKAVNDTYGHAVGDRVLIEVADRARGRLRGEDTLSRLGGDEFVVLVEELDPPTAGDVVQEICDSLLELLSEPVVTAHERIDISASIGAVLSAGFESAEDLLHAADVAMYDAKASGRGCWRMHRPGMSTPGHERHAVHQLLLEAMAEHQVAVLHQPIVDLRDGSPVGVEVLARIVRRDGSVSEPRLFIPVAETTGLIHQLGRHVLEAAAASAGSDGAWFAVNVSPTQVAEPTFERVVLEVLGAQGVDPSRVVFDITESDALAVEDRMFVTNLHRLHDRGVRFALDDFGRTSSLHRFRHLPLSFIKLDQAFVSGVANVGSGDLAVVRAVLGMADAMGVPVIAEGVETPLQQRILRQVGVPLAQGYLFARPAPPARI